MDMCEDIAVIVRRVPEQGMVWVLVGIRVNDCGIQGVVFDVGGIRFRWYLA